MNREFKFRAWDTKNKKFNYELFISNEGLYDIYNDYGGMFSSGLVKEDVSGRFIIQQYTGLKDSCGVDIYEGDIIQYSIKCPSPIRIRDTDGEMMWPECYEEEIVFREGMFCAYYALIHEFGKGFRHQILQLSSVNKISKVTGHINDPQINDVENNLQKCSCGELAEYSRESTRASLTCNKCQKSLIGSGLKFLKSIKDLWSQGKIGNVGFLEQY